MRLPKKSLSLALVAGSLVAIVGVGIFYAANSTSPLSKVVKSNLSNGAYIPDKSKSGKVLGESITFDNKDKVLVYDYVWQGIRLTITQQETPESFIDIPQAYEALVNNMQPAYSFEYTNGKVTITKPTKLSGDEVGVLNAKGILLFVRSKQALSQQNWKDIFSSLRMSNE